MYKPPERRLPLVPRDTMHRWRKRLSLRTPFLRTQQGRMVSWIRYDPRKKVYSDGEFEYEFREYGTYLQLVRINPRNREEIVFSRAELKDWKTNSNVKPSEITGKTIRPSGLGINKATNGTLVWPSNEQPRIEDRGRGVMPAYLDYLKRNEAKEVMIHVLKEELANYYKGLGFEIVGRENLDDNPFAIMKLDLSKFHLQEWE